MFTYGSVCSGIESASVAWHKFGWNCAFLSEIDPFARTVLQTRFPEYPLHGDFTTIKAGDYAPIDLLVGGTPCQSFSVAGLRRGFNDDRGNLTLQFVRLLDELRPEWFVWENVPGVLSSHKGRDFGSFLGALVDIGYSFAYRVLDAQFYGVPQRRRRVFVVGNRRTPQRAAAVLFERASLLRYSSARKKAREDFAGIPSPRLRSSSDPRAYSPSSFGLYTEGIKALRASSPTPAGKDAIIVGTLMASGAGMERPAGLPNEIDYIVTEEVATAVGTKWRNSFEDGETLISEIVVEPMVFQTRGSNVDVGKISGTIGTNADRVSGSAPMIVFDAAQVTSKTNRSNPRPGDPAHTLHRHAPTIAFSCKDYGGDAGDTSPTLRSMNFTSSHLNDAGQVAILSPIFHRARRLIPKECERLQGFPDDFTDVVFKNKPAADSHRYRALGNTMAVPVMEWIGEGIEIVRTMYP